MSNLYAEALTSLALLKVKYDEEQTDYLDYFEPFLLHCLSKSTEKFVSREDARRSLLEEFGLQLPLQVVELLLQRLVSNEVLESVEGNEAYLVQSEAVHSLEDKKQEAASHVREVTAQFQGFIESKYDEEWPIDKAEKSLVGLFDRFSTEYFASQEEGLLPELPVGEEDSLFYAYSFVAHALENDESTTESLEVFMRGNMLANALLCNDITEAESGLDSVSFVLDTSFTLKLLGYEGQTVATPCIELVRLLGQLDAQVSIFEQTRDEIDRVLEQKISAISEGRQTKGIAEYFRTEKGGETDLILKKSRLNKELESFEIATVSRPDFGSKNHKAQVDEEEVYSRLRESIDYSTDAALQHDAECLRDIYILRGSTRPNTIEHAKSIFVTDNTRLAFVAAGFDEDEYGDSGVGPVISDFALANLAWLKLPLKDSQLPRAELMAACYAGLNPDETLWRCFINEIQRLEDEGEVEKGMHQVLRESLVARRELVDLTRGSLKGFTDTTARDVLTRVTARMEARIRNEERERYLEKEKLHDQRFADFERRLTKQEQRTERAQREKEDKAEKLQATDAWLSRRRNTARKTVAILTNILLGATFALLLWLAPIHDQLASMSAVFLPFEESTLKSCLSSGAVVSGVLVGLFAHFSPWRVGQIGDRLGAWASEILYPPVALQERID